jgi:hypothetical protein
MARCYTDGNVLFYTEHYLVLAAFPLSFFYTILFFCEFFEFSFFVLLHIFFRHFLHNISRAERHAHGWLDSAERHISSLKLSKEEEEEKKKAKKTHEARVSLIVIIIWEDTEKRGAVYNTRPHQETSSRFLLLSLSLASPSLLNKTGQLVSAAHGKLISIAFLLPAKEKEHQASIYKYTDDEAWQQQRTTRDRPVDYIFRRVSPWMAGLLLMLLLLLWRFDGRSNMKVTRYG